MDYKLELVLMPVSDVHQAKEFYPKEAGFDLITDTPIGEGERVVQLNPPGSACSIGFGAGLTSAAPGAAQGPHRERADYQSFADFQDPDGNIWIVPEVDQSKASHGPR